MVDSGLLQGLAESAAGEWTMILSLVFGGCCSNVWALEAVLKDHPQSGTFLTFAQFLYVAIQTLSSQFYFPKQTPGQPRRWSAWIPRFKRNEVPLRRWFVQVILFLAVSLMNNYAFGLKIPVTVHIIFRSGGLCVSMLTGYFMAKKRYSAGQVVAGVIITAGIVLATLSAPRRRSAPSTSSASVASATTAQSSPHDWLSDNAQYTAGIALLSLALFFSAWLGIWQEHTYRIYGKKWREGLFYSHWLSLPFFAPLYPSLASTFASFTASPHITLFAIPQPDISFLVFPSTPAARIPSPIPPTAKALLQLTIPSAILALGVNVVTQGLCIRGVNRLTSRVSSTTVNLILTLRKAASLAISVWYYGSGISLGLAVGGAMVLGGTVIYSLAPAPQSYGADAEKSKKDDNVIAETDEIPAEELLKRSAVDESKSTGDLRHRSKQNQRGVS